MAKKATIVVVALLTVAASAAGRQSVGSADGYRDVWKFVLSYHQKPNAKKLVGALEKMCRSGVWAREDFGEGDEYIFAYFFARAAGTNSEILGGYVNLFENEAHRQRLFLLKVLQLCGNKSTEEYFRKKLAAGRFLNERTKIEEVLRRGIPYDFKVMAEPVDDARKVSLLWAEFLATGDRGAILKLISALGYDVSVPKRYERNGQQDTKVIHKAAKEVLITSSRLDKNVLGTCKQQWEKAEGAVKEGLGEVIDSVDGSISMKKWIDTAPELKPVTGAKGWALGCAAVLMERNHTRHDTLATAEITERAVIDERKLLDEWWGIRGKDDLYDSLNRLELGGHRSGFEGVGKFVESLSEEEYKAVLYRYKNDKEKQQEFVIAKKYYKELGPKSILGWDYSRYICLCRWGYTVGYISEEEAWGKIMPAARILQKMFDSWEDLGRNYIIGRQFWSYKQMQEDGYEYEDAFQRLMDMKSSPWNRYEWDMDLSEGGQE